MTETMPAYVARRKITCDILHDKGTQVEDGWEHHAYILALSCEGRTMSTPWKQGLGIQDSPTDRPDMILDSLISDATADSFEDWCADYGYDLDSRKAYATWQACTETFMILGAFLGSGDDVDYLAQNVERL